MRRVTQRNFYLTNRGAVTAEYLLACVVLCVIALQFSYLFNHMTRPLRHLSEEILVAGGGTSTTQPEGSELGAALPVPDFSDPPPSPVGDTARPRR